MASNSVFLDGAKIKQLRNARGLTHLQIHLEGGPSPNTMVSLEGGKPVTPKIASQLANVLDVDVRQLIMNKEQAAQLFFVPPPPPHFVPRTEQLARAVSALVENRNTSSIVAVCGMGGIGKTVLASTIAREDRIRRTYRDGVLWLTLGQEPVIEAVHSRIETILTIDRPSTSGPGTLKRRNPFVGLACLLILDDVWSAGDARPFAALVSGTQSRMLLTTREGQVATLLDAEEHSLDLMSPEQSSLLLAEWSDQPLSGLPRDALEVASECGNLPLAVAICGAMARDGIAWVDMLNALRDADLTFIESAGFPYDSTSGPNVYKALKVSVDYLARTHAEGPDKYFELAGFQKDEPIPEGEVIDFWCRDNPRYELERGQRNARKLLAILERKHLLSLEGDPPDRLVVLHDLQHDFIRAKYESTP